MKVRVRFYGLVYDEIGSRENVYEVEEGSTVGSLLDTVIEAYPVIHDWVYMEGVFRDYLEIAVNRTSIVTLDGLETKLANDDFVQIMPPIGGG